MSDKEQQVEEEECGIEGEQNTLLLEISWPEDYPTQKPLINLDIFYNGHLSPSVKEYIKEQLYEKADQYLGFAVTYTLFELTKDKLDSWLAECAAIEVSYPSKDDTTTISADLSNLELEGTNLKKAPKKEQLTKSQKRRQWDKGEGRDDKPRGWNWVDIIKHLSQTGAKTD